MTGPEVFLFKFRTGEISQHKPQLMRQIRRFNQLLVAYAEKRIERESIIAQCFSLISSARSVRRFPGKHIRKSSAAALYCGRSRYVSEMAAVRRASREGTSGPAGRCLDRRIGQHPNVVAPTNELGREAESRRDGAPSIDDGQQEASRRAAAAVVHPVGARQIKVCIRSAGSRSTVLRRFGRDWRPRESSPNQLGTPYGRSPRGIGA